MARLQVWQPAELDVAGIQRLAVLDFRGAGDSAQHARSELVARLWESGFYSLADPTELSGVVQASAASAEGPAGIDAAVEAGRRLGVDAILLGEVTRERPEHGSPGKNSRGDLPHDRGFGRRDPAAPPGGAGLSDYLRSGREVAMRVSLKLVDVRTGQVRAERQAFYRAGADVHNGQSSLPSEETATAELTQRWAREMVDLLTPHLIPFEVELAAPRIGKAAAEIRRGNGYAIKGKWDKAAAFYEAALALDPKSHAAMYNLALAHAARFDYSRALGLLQEAIRLHPNTTYREALSRMLRHEQAYLTAMAQKRQQTDLPPAIPDPWP